MQPLDYYYSLSPMPPFMRSTKKKNQASQGLLLFKASSCGMVIKKVVTTEPILGYTALLYVEHQERPPPFLCTEKKMNQTHHRKSLCKSFLGQNGSLIAHFCPYQTYKFSLSVPWDTTNWCCQKAKKKLGAHFALYLLSSVENEI